MGVWSQGNEHHGESKCLDSTVCPWRCDLLLSGLTPRWGIHPLQHLDIRFCFHMVVKIEWETSEVGGSCERDGEREKKMLMREWGRDLYVKRKVVIYIWHIDVLSRVWAGGVWRTLVSWQEWKTFEGRRDTKAKENSLKCVILPECAGVSKLKTLKLSVCNLATEARLEYDVFTAAKSLTAVIINLITIPANDSPVQLKQRQISAQFSPD